MNNRKIVIGVIVALVVICCCCIVVGAAVVVVDPFQWKLMDRFTGSGDPLAKAMPADTSMYVGVNLLAATPDKVNRVMQPFSDVSTDVKSIDDLKKQLDDTMLKDLGMTFKDDIEPWVGQYLGVGISSLELDEYGSLKSAHFVVAIEARDTKKADDFVAKLKSKATETDKVEETTYQGANLVTVTPEYGEGLVFGRSGNLVLAGLYLDDVKKAIDTQKGGASLADNAAYKKMLQELPNGRTLTAYVDMQKFADMYVGLLNTMSTMQGGSSLSSEQLQLMKDYMKDAYAGMEGVGLSMSIVDAGLQLDTISTYDVQKLSPEQKTLTEKGGAATKVIELLPDNTFFFEGATIPNAFWTQLPGIFVKTGAIKQEELDQSMAQFKEQFGFDPIKDLLAYLDGEMAMAAFPSSDGLLASTAKVNMGVAMILETNNPDAVMSSLKQFATAAEPMGIPMKWAQAGDLNYFEIQDPNSGNAWAALGVNNPYLAAATSGDSLKALFAKNPSLAQNARYRQVTGMLPGGMKAFLYVDVAGMMGAIREGMSGDSLQTFNEAAKFLEPIPTVLGGSAMNRSGSSRSTIIIFIKPATTK